MNPKAQYSKLLEQKAKLWEEGQRIQDPEDTGVSRSSTTVDDINPA